MDGLEEAGELERILNHLEYQVRWLMSQKE